MIQNHAPQAVMTKGKGHLMEIKVSVLQRPKIYQHWCRLLEVRAPSLRPPIPTAGAAPQPGTAAQYLSQVKCQAPHLHQIAVGSLSVVAVCY